MQPELCDEAAFYRQLGANIRAQREAILMPQAELGAAAGCTAGEISRIESGTRVIGLERLQQIADALGLITAISLLPGKTRPMPEPADRMLRLFSYQHLESADLRGVSALFSDLAHRLAELVPAGPERTVSLRRLLESKDAAVRAVAIPE